VAIIENTSSFTKEWALKWLRGSIESYFLGKTPLEILRGRVKAAVKSYGIKPREVRAIVNSLLLDPLVNTSRTLAEERARPLLEFIEELEKGEKSG